VEELFQDRFLQEVEMRPIFLTFVLLFFLVPGCASHDPALLEQRIFGLEKRVEALEARDRVQVDQAEEIVRADLAKLRAERTALSGMYTENHPEMQNIVARIRALERELRAMPARRELAELKAEREKMKYRYTNAHPEMIEINQRIKDLLEVIGE
jgi:uncharacterized protein involved in exopolysaccharide biosynthesis